MEKLTPRSAATRAKLLAVAQRLFADRGIDATSLNEICKAADQRNSNVCQYHFGSKEGLLQAILDKHTHGITARRDEILNRLEHQGRLDVRELSRAFILPVAEKLSDPEGGREFIRINAQLIALHTLSAFGMPASALRLARADRFRRAMVLAAAEFRLPELIVQQRLILISVLLFHGLADHSRMLDAVGLTDSPAANPVTHTGVFLANLEDSIVGLMSAPVSVGTNARLGQLS